MTGRDRTVLGAVVLVAILAAYWLLLLSPKRAEVTKLSTEVTKQQKTASDARAQLAAAQGSKRDYAKNYATIARLGQAVPTDDNVPSLVFQVDAAARASRVDFRAVKLTGTVTAATPAATPTTPGTTSPSGGTSTTPASTTPASTTPATTTPATTTPATGTASTASAATPTQAATATLPPGAAVGPAGFPTMPFTLTFEGSFFHVAEFFHRLQRFVDAGGKNIRIGGRLLTLDGVALGASRFGFPRVKATVAATAYLIPEEQALMTGESSSSDGTAQPTSASVSPSSAPASATLIR